MLKVNNYTNSIRRLASLYMENGRLLLAEKLTVILAGMALGLIAIGLGIITVMFVGFGAAAMLRNVMEPFWAYAIVAGAFLLLILCIVIFRHSLIVNPIARMVSSALIPDPQPAQPVKTDDDENKVERV